VPLAGVVGQDVAITTLRRALARGKVHHAYRFEGPDGVGKERAAMALAQALVCTERGEGDDDACGQCSACKRALKLTSMEPHVPVHPDVILLGRGLYALEASEKTELSVEQVRKVVLPHGAYPPHEGRARVFVIRAADELSIGAANALLKTLEEPLARTHFVLLTSRPERLLPTVRSRTLPVRFGRLPDATLGALLRERGFSAEQCEAWVPLADGSMSQALAMADADAANETTSFAHAVLTAIDSPTVGAGTLLGEGIDKGVARAVLVAASALLARQARELTRSDPGAASRAARRYAALGEGVRRLDRNGAPALTVTQAIFDARRA
jgi:DNA polymerase-3 subunit delta'